MATASLVLSVLALAVSAVALWQSHFAPFTPLAINQVILFHIFLTWSETVTCEEHSNVMSSWSRMLGGDQDELLHFGFTSGATPLVLRISVLPQLSEMFS